MSRTQKLSAILGIHSIAISSLLIATSTSLPEVFVGITAVLSHDPAILVGNALGATAALLLLSLGVLTLVRPIEMYELRRSIVIRASYVLAFVLSLLLIMGKVTPFVSLLLLAIFSYFATRTFQESTQEKEGGKPAKILAEFFLALLLIVFGARLVVYGVERLAEILKTSTFFLSLLLVSLSTTAPELTVELTAARRKRIDVAIGDLFGSAVFNTTLVLAVPGLFQPYTIPTSVVIPIAGILFAIGVIGYRTLTMGGLTRRDGILLLITYVLMLGASL